MRLEWSPTSVHYIGYKLIGLYTLTSALGTITAHSGAICDFLLVIVILLASEHIHFFKTVFLVTRVSLFFTNLQEHVLFASFANTANDNKQHGLTSIYLA